MRHIKKFEGFDYEKRSEDLCPECGYEMEHGSCPVCEADDNDNEMNEKRKIAKKKKEKEEFNFSKKSKKEDKEDKEEPKAKGLTAAQKRLPPGLRAAIEKKMK